MTLAVASGTGIIRDISALHPKFQPIVRTWMVNCSRVVRVQICVAETWRALDVQRAYYAVGRRPFEEVADLYEIAGLRAPLPSDHKRNTQCITQVPPGLGWHPYGLALDFYPMVNGKLDTKYDPKDPADYWDEIAGEATKLGMLWGQTAFRTFKDTPHLEYHPGYSSSRQAKAIYDKTGDWRIPLAA